MSYREGGRGRGREGGRERGREGGGEGGREREEREGGREGEGGEGGREREEREREIDSTSDNSQCTINHRFWFIL